jgi:hypothetical protein
MEFVIEYKYNLNTIQFFSETRNRKCLKLDEGHFTDNRLTENHFIEMVI